MENLLYSLNTVIPLFALIGLGVFLKRIRLLNDGFVSVGTKLVFKVALPCYLFKQISEADLTQTISPDLFWFLIVSVLAVTGLLMLLVPVFVKNDRPACGALVQGIFRGNYAILGLPLAVNMFGTEGALPTALTLPITVPLINSLAVVVLSVFAPRDGSVKKQSIGSVLLEIIKNPLIIATALALPFAFLHVEFPTVFTSTLSSVSSLSTPLALICLGAQFDWQNARHNLRRTVPATLLRQVFIPIVVLAVAVAFGFRDGELGALFIIFMAPTSTSSYVMAINMRSDAQVAAQMILWTTLLSVVTIFFGVFLFRSWGLM